MIVDGRHDSFEIACKCGGEIERQSPESQLEDFRVRCDGCGGVASVHDDAGIIKVYPIDGADIDATVV